MENHAPQPWFLSLLQLGAHPEDSLDLRTKKRILVVGSYLVMSATLVWGVVFILLDEPLAGVISLIYAAVTLISLFIFRRTRRYFPIQFVQLVMGLLLPFAQMLALGGYANSGAVLLWSLMSPLGALLLEEPRKAIRWWAVFFLLLLAAWGLEPYLRPSNNLPLWLIDGLFVLNISAVSGLVIGMLIYFVNQKDRAYELLSLEEEKSEQLLLNVLPKEIALLLKDGEQTIAERFEAASVLFADLVSFTQLSARLDPEEMVHLLNDIFSHFDELVEKYGLEKIRTIGDNYMVAAGVPRPQPDHAKAIARLALDMRAYLENRNGEGGVPMEFRIGINSGPVIGGVIGRKKFVYDVWGDAVNVASRMESHGVPGEIQISERTHRMIEADFKCEPRGTVAIKGKGEMQTWFLIAEK